jgi:hypothetical protein
MGAGAGVPRAMGCMQRRHASQNPFLLGSQGEVV